MTFTAAAGQIVSVTMTSGTITTGSFTLINPINNGIVSGLITNGTATLGRVALDTAGTYSLRFWPSTPATGGISVTVYDARDSTVSASIGGPAVTVPINVPYQQAVVTFTAAAGQIVSVTMTSGTITTGSFTLINPINPINPINNVGIASGLITNGTAFIDRLVLSTAGTYTLRLTPSSGATGNATIAVYDAKDLVLGQ